MKLLHPPRNIIFHGLYCLDRRDCSGRFRTRVVPVLYGCVTGHLTLVEGVGDQDSADSIWTEDRESNMRMEKIT